jgi:CHAT domain-containing protein
MRFSGKETQTDNGRLLVFGNPTLDLSYASQEANTVAKMYKTQAIIGAKATKDVLQAKAKHDSVLHLAMHGEFNAINPLFSALFLAPNKGKDERLEVHEIYELDLTKATNLVVLSACQSQVGELSRATNWLG